MKTLVVFFLFLLMAVRGDERLRWSSTLTGQRLDASGRMYALDALDRDSWLRVSVAAESLECIRIAVQFGRHAEASSDYRLPTAVDRSGSGIVWHFDGADTQQQPSYVLVFFDGDACNRLHSSVANLQFSIRADALDVSCATAGDSTPLAHASDGAQVSAVRLAHVERSELLMSSAFVSDACVNVGRRVWMHMRRALPPSDTHYDARVQVVPHVAGPSPLADADRTGDAELGAVKLFAPDEQFYGGGGEQLWFVSIEEEEEEGDSEANANDDCQYDVLIDVVENRQLVDNGVAVQSSLAPGEWAYYAADYYVHIDGDNSRVIDRLNLTVEAPPGVRLDVYWRFGGEFPLVDNYDGCEATGHLGRRRLNVSIEFPLVDDTMLRLGIYLPDDERVAFYSVQVDGIDARGAAPPPHHSSSHSHSHSHSSDDGLTALEISFIVLGSVAAVAIVVALAIVIVRRRRQKADVDFIARATISPNPVQNQYAVLDQQDDDDELLADSDS
jgi:hypothetical protein